MIDLSDDARPGRHLVADIMGMPIGIDLRDKHVDPAVLDDAFDWFRWVDAIFSTYRPESEISRINRGDLALFDAHPDVQAILARCEDLKAETDGYFDISTVPLPESGLAGAQPIPGAADPSGLVKGWSVDRAVELLEEAGAENFAVNAGGDIRVRGGALPDTSWRVGIRHPIIHDKVAAVVQATDLAVATSGTYERGEHIVDPHTGLAPAGVLSVTIVGQDLGTADAYATAAFAMGESAPSWVPRLFGYEAMLIMADETVLKTRWFPE